MANFEVEPLGNLTVAGQGILATDIRRVVIANKEELLARRFDTTVESFATTSAMSTTAIQFDAARYDTASKLSFAIRKEYSHELAGMGWIEPGAPLKQLLVPIPTHVATWPIAVKYPLAGPMIRAWIDKDIDPVNLSGIYDRIADYVALRPNWNPNRGFIWTLEPTCAPRFVHEAIANSKTF